MGANAIQNGAITANHIAVGTVVAGIINGTTITGATFQGTNWVENSLGSFMYSGTPATGNLIASIAPAAGSNDGHGNAFLAGIVSYNGGLTIQLTTGTANFYPFSGTPHTPGEIFAGGTGTLVVQSPTQTSGDSQSQLAVVSGNAYASAGGTVVIGPSGVRINGSTSSAALGLVGDAHISGNLVMGNMNGSASLPLGTISTLSGSSTMTDVASAVNGLISRLQSVGIIS
jgi:hypothetical protein